MAHNYPKELIELRTSLNLNRRDFSELIGMTYATYKGIENGNQGVGKRSAAILDKVLEENWTAVPIETIEKPKEKPKSYSYDPSAYKNERVVSEQIKKTENEAMYSSYGKPLNEIAKKRDEEIRRKANIDLDRVKSILNDVDYILNIELKNNKSRGLNILERFVGELRREIFAV